MGHYLVGLPAHLPLQAQHGATPPLGPPSRRPFSPAAAAAPLVASSILFFPPRRASAAAAAAGWLPASLLSSKIDFSPPQPATSPRSDRRRYPSLILLSAATEPGSPHRVGLVPLFGDELLLPLLIQIFFLSPVHPVCSRFDCCVRGVLY